MCLERIKQSSKFSTRPAGPHVCSLKLGVLSKSLAVELIEYNCGFRIFRCGPPLAFVSVMFQDEKHLKSLNQSG